jgi:hypothetical protein
VIHYHGTPCGGPREQVAKFLRGRHALIPFVRPEDIATAADECQSFCIDNGAFTAWKQGVTINWQEYYDFCDQWRRHPAFDWAIIPDVIDGTTAENEALIGDWIERFGMNSTGVPVWHMNESICHLEALAAAWPRVAIGSSGDYANVGDDKWWHRISQAMAAVCDEHGRPTTKLHGLRMLDPAVFRHLPLASADSTNAVRNANQVLRFGNYPSPNISTRMSAIAERIEIYQSAAAWLPGESQATLF